MSRNLCLLRHPKTPQSVSEHIPVSRSSRLSKQREIHMKQPTKYQQQTTAIIQPVRASVFACKDLSQSTATRQNKSTSIRLLDAANSCSSLEPASAIADCGDGMCVTPSTANSRSVFEPITVESVSDNQCNVLPIIWLARPLTRRLSLPVVHQCLLTTANKYSTVLILSTHHKATCVATFAALP